MNVEAIPQANDLGAAGRSGEGAESGDEFSGVLRSAIGQEESTEPQSADARASSSEQSADTRSGDGQADAERDSEGSETEGRSADSDEAAAGDAREDSAEINEAIAEESAQAASEAGVVGEVPLALQTVKREGASLEATAVSDGRVSALDPNGQAAGPDVGTRPATDTAREVRAEAAVPVEGEAGRGGSADAAAARSEGDPAAADGVGRADLEEARIATGESAAAEADRANAPLAGTTTAGTPEVGAADGNATSATEANANLNLPAEGASSRSDELAAVRAEGASTEGESSAGEREDRGDARQDSDQRSLADADANGSTGQGDASTAAEAAAAYAATGEASRRVESAAPAESGVAAAGAIAAAAPETASAPTAPTANAPQPAAASDAIAVQTEWLATRGGGSARLRLNPAELGEIEIRVSVRAGVVDVVMVAQEALTQAVAEEQSERLAQAFANRDLRMDSFDVRRGDSLGAEGEAPNDFAQSRGEGEDGTRRQEQGADGRSNAPGQVGRAASQRAAVPPQILVTGPEASVDLRA